MNVIVTTIFWKYSQKNYCIPLKGKVYTCLLYTSVMVSWIHMDEYISKIAVSVIVVIVNYVFSKLFIFRKSEEKSL